MLKKWLTNEVIRDILFKLL